MDHSALKTEINTDSAGLGYADLSNPDNDVATAEKLNAKVRDSWRPLSQGELLAWSAARATRSKIWDAARNVALDHAVRSVCFAAENLFLISEPLQLRLQDRRDLIEALVTASVIDAADRDALLAMAAVKISRAEEIQETLGAAFATPSDVARARAQT